MCYGMGRMERSEANVLREGTQRSQGTTGWDAWDAAKKCTMGKDTQDTWNANAKSICVGMLGGTFRRKEIVTDVNSLGGTRRNDFRTYRDLMMGCIMGLLFGWEVLFTTLCYFFGRKSYIYLETLFSFLYHI